MIWFNKKSSALSEFMVKKAGFFFARDNPNNHPSCQGKKQYSFLNSYEDFLEFEKKVKKTDRNFYEVILGEKQRYEYYDLDGWDYAEFPSYKSFLNHFIYWRKKFRDNFYISDVIVLEACAYNEEKNLIKGSLHIIIKSMVFSNQKCQKIWAKRFSEFLEQNEAKIRIDMAVYSKDQLFRLEGSTKKDKNRFFKRVPNYGDLHKNSFVCHDVDINKIWDEEEEVKKDLLERQKIMEEKVKNLKDLDNPKIYEDVREQILAGTHKKCDSEIKDKLNYNTWISFCYSIMASFGFQFLETRWDEIWSLYRHCDNYDMNSQLNSLRAIQIEPSKSAFYKVFGDKKNFKIKAIYLNDKWVRPINTDKKNLIVKAYMGKGKTTAIKDYLERNKDKSVIFLTSRRSFASSLFKSLNGFVSYSGKTAQNINRENRLILQVESLFKLERAYDIVVLDECESILYQMTSIKTHKSNIVLNMEKLKTLLNSSKINLWFDAFISSKTLNFLERMDMTDLTEYQIYTTLPEKRTAYFISEQKDLLGALISDLKAGKRSYFYCSSKKKLTEFFIPNIISNLPDKKVKVYNSKELNSLNDVNKEWSELDLVATTSSITVGVNFDKRNHFDNIYIYMNACSKNNVRDVFQAHMRVRHIRDNVLKFCLNTKLYGVSSSLPISKTELKKHVDLREEILQSDYKTKFLEIDPIFKELYVDNKREHNLSIICLEKIFNSYLIKCGYDLGVSDEIEYLFNLETVKIEPYMEYNVIRSICKDEYYRLLQKEKIEGVSKEEKAQMEKYLFQNLLLEIHPDKEIYLWDLYCDYGKSKFNQIRFEKCESLREELLKIVSETHFMSQPILSRLKVIEEICHMLGMKNSNDLITLQRDKIREKAEHLKGMKERIKNVFELRDRAKGDKFEEKEAVSLLNEVFQRWGYTKIESEKRRQKRINGKSVDVSGFNVIEAEDVYKYIKPIEIRQTYKSLLIDGNKKIEIN